MIIISYRIKVIIPETEMFLISVPEGGYVLHSMCGAKLDYVITYVDRENNFAVASRKIALEKMQKASNRRNISDRIIDADVVSVGRNVCLLNYGGYDVLLRQRDINYTMVSDIREIVHTGEVRKAKVKRICSGRRNFKTVNKGNNAASIRWSGNTSSGRLYKSCYCCW